MDRCVAKVPHVASSRVVAMSTMFRHEGLLRRRARAWDLVFVRRAPSLAMGPGSEWLPARRRGGHRAAFASLHRRLAAHAPNVRDRMARSMQCHGGLSTRESL